MLVCPLCRLALGAHDAVCPRDGNLGHEASWNVVPAALEKRFTLIAPFAHGPTGSTYLSDEPETGRRGLLKVMAPAPRAQAAERQRMRRELLKQATMAASNLALPFVTGETDGTLWLFREHIEGIALNAHLSKHGPLPTAQALSIAAQLTSALDELHRAGLLHRDVKPAHVILANDETGAPRGVLIDAGVCKPLEGARTSGVIFGTAGYVAPEQLAGKLVSFRSDLYALGCVLYEMLTARAPFARTDIDSTLAAQQEGALPAFPSGLSPQVAALVTSLLSRDPQDRPFSAQKLRRALDPFLPYGATVNRHPNASLNKAPADKPVMSKVAPSRIPGLPSGPPQRTMGRSSVPPPPPARGPTQEATQVLQVEQIMEMAASPKPSAPRPASMPPPPMPRRSAESEAARKRDATSPVELESVLEVKQSKPKKPKADDTLSNDKTIEKPKPERPSADMTQPIRLEQVLAVMAQHKKALSAPPPAPASHMPPAPIAAAPGAQVGAAPLAAVPAASRDETLIDEEAPSVEVPIPDDVAVNPLSAVLDQPAEPPRLPVRAIPAPNRLEAKGSASAHISLIPDHIAEDDHDDEGSSEAAATVVARPNADRRSAYPTLTGMPNFVMPPAAGTVARGSEAPAPNHAAETPQQVAAAYVATDSSQLTLPRDPSAAIEEAQRMDAQHREPAPAQQAARSPAPRIKSQARTKAPGDDSIFVLVSPQKRKIGYAAAALLLLSVVGFGAAQLFGDDEKAIAKQEQREPGPSDTPAASGALPKPAPAPTAAPIAAVPNGEPTPTVTRIEVVQPEVPPPAAAPAEPKAKVEAKEDEEDKPARSARSERSSRRERSASRRESSENDKGDNQELWSKARDEARAHYAAKRYKQAADAYAEATKYNSSHAGTYAGLGGARLQAGDARGAIQAYQRAVKLSPDTSGFHAALGKAYLNAGDKSKAKASYKRALALDPKNEAAKAALSTL